MGIQKCAKLWWTKLKARILENGGQIVPNYFFLDIVHWSWKFSRCVVRCKCNNLKGKHFDVSETPGVQETPENAPENTAPENAPENAAPENAAPENGAPENSPENAAPEPEPELFMQIRNGCKCQVRHLKNIKMFCY